MSALDYSVEAGVRQLFIDDVLIERTENLQRVVNRPVKYGDNPVLAPDQVWEDQEGLIYPTGCIMYDYDEKVFKMWYQIVNYTWTESMLAYAVSEDGIQWQKPNTGYMYELAKRLGAKHTNILLFAGGHAFDWPIVWRDPHEKDESKRYKLAFGQPFSVIRSPRKRFYVGAGSTHHGMGVGFSRDGHDWDLYPGNPVLRFEGEAPYVLLWEPKSQRYVCYIRLWARPDHPESTTCLGAGGVRVIGRTESEDFLHWTDPHVCLGWDDFDPELNRHIYNMEVIEYEGLYVGFLSMYHITGVPDRERRKGIEHVEKLPEDIPGLDTLDIQLAVSRDSWSWRKVGNESWEEVGGPGTFIPLGEEGEFDCAMLYPLQAPLLIGDEVWIYYAGMQDKHWSTRRGEPQRGAIGLAKLKRDRFVSMENQGGAIGVLTTKPFVLQGNALKVNCDASNGKLDVEILAADGGVLEGFAKEDCLSIRGDEISAEVKWAAREINNLGQQTVRLRFYVDHAKLYSFAVVD
jgi:hypothetical protein